MLKISQTVAALALSSVVLMGATAAQAQAPLESWRSELASLGAAADWAAATPDGSGGVTLDAFSLTLGPVQLTADAEPFALSFDDAGAAVLLAPPATTLNRINPATGAFDNPLSIKSTDMQLRVDPIDGVDTDLILTAAEATITEPGQDDNVNLTDLQFVFRVSSGDADLPFDAGAILSAATATVSPDDASTLTLSGVFAEIGAEPNRVVAEIVAESAAYDRGEEAQATADGFRLAAELTPTIPLAGPSTENPLDALAGLAQAAGFGLLNRGALDFELTLESAQGAVQDGSEGGELSLDLVVLAGEVRPERIGLNLSGREILFDVRGDFPQSGSAQGVALELAALGGESGFTLSQLLLSGDPASAVWPLIVNEIRTGGSLLFTAALDSSTSEQPVPLAEAGIEFVTAEAGAYASEVSLTREALSVSAGGDAVVYRLVGPDLDANARFSNFDFLLDAPMSAADAPQLASTRLVLGSVDIDDALWDRFIDPNGALERSIGGLELALNAEVLLLSDIVVENPVMLMLAPPAVPRRATLETLSLDALGLRLDGTGDVELPIPNAGAFDLAMTGWRGFVDGVSATPWGGTPDVLNSLLQADGFVQAFGATGESADEILFEIRGEGGVWTVNGTPLPF